MNFRSSLRSYRPSEIASRAGQALLDVVFPAVCLHCEIPIASDTEADHALCGPCRRRLDTCRYRGSDITIFSEDQEAGSSVMRGGAVWVYAPGSPVRSLHRALKYGGRPDLGHWIGRQMGYALRRQIGWIRAGAVCVPVPSHPLLIRERGYNHAAVLAEGAAGILRIDVHTDAVHRSRLRPSQSAIGRDRRESNVSGAFEIVRPDVFRHRTVILLDDVMTTGATLRSLARTIAASDAAFLYAFTMAVRKVR